MMGWWRRWRQPQDGVEQVSREFLPAAIELEKTPANPWARAILWSIMLLFTAAVIWAIVGRVNVVAIAEGSLVPNGNTRPIQPTQLGRVATLHVEDGDRVAAGDPLVTLDGTETQAEVQRLEEAVEYRQRKVNRLGTWVHYLRGQLRQLDAGRHPARDIPPLMEDPLLESRLAALRDEDSAIGDRLQALETEIQRVGARIKQLEQTLPLDRKQAEALQVLQEKDMASRVEWYERQRVVHQSEGELNTQRLRREQLRSEVSELRHQRRQLWSEALLEAEIRREEVNAEVQDLDQELIKARSLNQQQVLKAPVDGLVHNLQINTIGSVVQPAEPVMEIIPEDEPMIAEAWIQNRDIGFVQEGQEASLKIQAFKFTRYGTLPGTVKRISDDAVVAEDNEKAGARYKARIELEKEYMDIGKRRVRLSPGMQITAEVATGHRRLIEFFAAPIVSALDETGRER